MTNNTSHYKFMVVRLAELLWVAAPLASLVSSDDFTDEDRGRLRELVGRERFNELVNSLDDLY